MIQKLRPKRYILLGVFFAYYSVYLIWRIFYTIPFSYGLVAVIFGLLLLLAELVGYFESISFYMTVHDTKTPSTPRIRASKFPEVDVYIAAYNEPLELLFKTIVGCCNMDYPDREKKVHIHICDDGHRPELAEMCRDLNIGYITRDDNKYAKAGNLNNALLHTSAPFVVTFDADMIPMHDFLMKTIPFFMEEKKVGFVQVPQNFYNADSFQYNLFAEKKIPNEQQLFSRLIQAGKMKYNAVIYAGSNTVISRQALEEIGGFVVGTITEDFATGMLIESKGYQSIYLNEIHASGLAPENLEDLYSQRIRWGRGVIQTFKAHNPLKIKGIDFKQKIMYLSALTYWYFGIWRFIYIMAPILFSVFGIVILKTTLAPLLYIWLPMFLLSKLTFKVFSNNFRTTTWSHIYDTVMFPQVTLGVIEETLGIKLTKFNVTPKENVVRGTFQNKYTLVRVQIILLILSIIGIVKMLIGMFISLSPQFFVMNIFWLGYNIFLLSTAIIFASERPKFRRYERMQIMLKAVMTIGNRVIRCSTFDVSENGISLIISSNEYLDKNTPCKIKIERGRYTASFTANLVYVSNVKENEYKYSFEIRNIDRQNYCQLILILYDRSTTFLDEYAVNNFMKLLVDNVKSRFTPLKEMNRKQPRFAVDKYFAIESLDKIDEVYIHDINFSFCSVRSDEKFEKFVLRFGSKKNYELRCEYDDEISKKNPNGYAIYKVLNQKNVINDVFLEELNHAGNTHSTEMSCTAGSVV